MFWGYWGDLGLFEAILGGFRVVLGAIFGVIEVIWGRFGVLGVILGCFGVVGVILGCILGL